MLLLLYVFVAMTQHGMVHSAKKEGAGPARSLLRRENPEKIPEEAWNPKHSLYRPFRPKPETWALQSFQFNKPKQKELAHRRQYRLVP